MRNIATVSRMNAWTMSAAPRAVRTWKSDQLISSIPNRSASRFQKRFDLPLVAIFPESSAKGMKLHVGSNFRSLSIIMSASLGAMTES
jgi:hypothetical protein